MPGDDGDYVSWAQLHDEARAVGAALQARGIQPGDHVAILGPTSRPLVTIIQGCWLAGAASMVLPLPMRMGSLEAFVESTRARIRHGDAKLVLIDDLLAAFYEAVPGDPPLVPMADVLPGPGRPGPEAVEIPAADPERLVILQYTSGSTSEPKGVMIPDRVFGANIDAAVAGVELVDGDVLVSWLPLYHDMGLVGCLGIPMLNGIDLVQAAPQDFLAHPGHWMEWLSPLPGHGHGRAELLLGAGHPGPAAAEGPRPVADAHRAERRRADRSRSRGGVRGGRRALRIPAGRRVPRLRHGRGRHRRVVLAARCGGWCATPSTARCWSGIGWPSRSRSPIRMTRR